MKIATQEIIDFLKIAYDGAVEFDKKLKHGAIDFDSIYQLLATAIAYHPERVVGEFATNILNKLEDEKDFP